MQAQVVEATEDPFSVAAHRRVGSNRCLPAAAAATKGQQEFQVTQIVANLATKRELLTTS